MASYFLVSIVLNSTTYTVPLSGFVELLVHNWRIIFSDAYFIAKIIKDDLMIFFAQTPKKFMPASRSIGNPADKTLS